MQPTKFPKKDTIQWLEIFRKKFEWWKNPGMGGNFIFWLPWSEVSLTLYVLDLWFLWISMFCTMSQANMLTDHGIVEYEDGYSCHYQTYQNVKEWINQNQQLLLDMFLVISTWLPYVVTASYYIEQHFAEPIKAFKAEQETWLFNSEVFCCRTRHKRLALKCHKSQKSPWSDSKPFNMRMFQPFWWGCLSNPGSLVRGGGLTLHFFSDA